MTEAGRAKNQARNSIKLLNVAQLREVLIMPLASDIVIEEHIARPSPSPSERGAAELLPPPPTKARFDKDIRVSVLFLAWLVRQVFCCLWAGEAARHKGHDELSWTLMALFLGPFALLALCAMPDLKSQRILRLMAESQGVDLGKKDPPKPEKKPLTQEDKDALKDVMW